MTPPKPDPRDIAAVCAERRPVWNIVIHTAQTALKDIDLSGADAGKRVETK